jgi:hypothetical protein
MIPLKLEAPPGTSLKALIKGFILTRVLTPITVKAPHGTVSNLMTMADGQP